MRKNIFWRLLGGFGKGEVRIHQSKKREIVFFGLSHTRVQAGTGERIYINILCAFGEKREVWRKLVFRWYWCSLRKMSSLKFLIVYSSGEIFCVWQTVMALPAMPGAWIHGFSWLCLWAVSGKCFNLIAGQPLCLQRVQFLGHSLEGWAGVAAGSLKGHTQHCF